MWKKLLIVAVVLLLLMGLIVATAIIGKSRSRGALEAYKAELIARGEALTWEALGYPPAGETNVSMDAFLSAVSRLGKARPQPSQLEHMDCVGPGVAQAAWAATYPPESSSGQRGASPATWEQFIADMDGSSNALADIRAFLETPPSYFPMNLTNPLAPGPKNPFVQKRTAAQWLAADCLVRLHQQNPERAQADLLALTQMTQLHRDDITLVNTMIRVAISGLGLAVTWETLQAQNLSEERLSKLQQAWEDIDLVDAMERGMVGERIRVPQLFENAASGKRSLIQFLSGAGGTWSLGDLPEAVAGRMAFAYWRNHIYEDQLLYLQMKQERIDILRRLGTNASGLVLRREIADQDAELNSLIGDPIRRHRYLVTAIAMPNYARAFQTLIRTETQRRMTVTAIALQRHQLAHGSHPRSLSELVPEFFTEVLIDPMSGQPFGYRTNATGAFTLYSVGEDGVDDGGDATATNTVTSFDLWSGRDAVWPRAVTNNTAPNP